jgi:PAS domain S-box-containing protein
VKAQLQISDYQFRILADNVPTLCWMADPDGFIFWYNRRWFEYTGTTPAEMEGWGWQSVHDPEKLPQVLERWRESIATGQPFEMVFPLKAADGSYKPFLTRVSPHRDVSGTVTSWFGVNTDIAEQIEAENALRESEAKFHTFAQAMPNHVWTSPPDGMLDWFNDQVYEFSGTAPGDLDGQSWAKIVHPDNLDAAAASWAASLSSGKPYQSEFRLRRYDGLYRWHVARALPIIGSDGDITRWIGTNTDIESQKNTAEALTHLNATLEEEVAKRTAELL